MFDDQRPGWDFTSGDIGKFRLTPEEVEVRGAARVPARRAFRLKSAEFPARRDARPVPRRPTLPPSNPPSPCALALRSQAKKKLHTSKHLGAARAALVGRGPGQISVRPGARDTHRVLDRGDFEGSDASRSLSPSPERERRRNADAPGAGIGPVRFAPPNSPGRFEGGASEPAPLAHERDDVAEARRMLAEPPATHNPRRDVPFRPAPLRENPGERGLRKVEAVKRAHSKGWKPAKAPEWNNPNGTGKMRRPPPSAAKKGQPTVAFEEEFEQFKMQKLREKAAGARGPAPGSSGRGGGLRRGGYAVSASEDDFDEASAPDAAGFDPRAYAEYEEQEDETEGEEGEDPEEEEEEEDSPSSGASGGEWRDARGVHTPARADARGSGGALATPTTKALLERQEAIRRRFGPRTSPDPPEGAGRRAGSESERSESSIDAARVSPAGFGGAATRADLDAVAAAAAAAAAMTPGPPLADDEAAALAGFALDPDGSPAGPEFDPGAAPERILTPPRRSVPGALPDRVESNPRVRPPGIGGPASFPDVATLERETARLRFQDPPPPAPGVNLNLWPTPFGRQKNDLPRRAVDASKPEFQNFPKPPPEERGLPRYGDAIKARAAGLQSVAFQRSVALGAVGAVGFSGRRPGEVSRRAHRDGSHADAFSSRAAGGAASSSSSLAPAFPGLPPGFAAGEKIDALERTLARGPPPLGSDATSDEPRARVSAAGAEDARAADRRFAKRRDAHRRGVDEAMDERAPEAPPSVQKTGGDERAAGDDGAAAFAESVGGGAGGAARAKVSGRQTMSLRAHAEESSAGER